MNQREKLIYLIEKRKSEAAKKDLSIKLKKIVSTYGHEIRAESGDGGSFESFGRLSTDRSDILDFDEVDTDEFPTMEEGTVTSVVMKHFDGLSSGLNFQISYYEAEKTLLAYFEGRKAYEESQGQLTVYVPNDLWENFIEMLFQKLETKSKLNETEQNAEINKGNKHQLSFVLDYLRDNWGIDLGIK